MKQRIEGYIPIKEVVQKLDGLPYAHKTQYCINGYCMKNKIDCINVDGRWYISEKYIVDALEWRSQVAQADIIIKNYIEETTPEDALNFSRTVKRLINPLYIKKEPKEALLFVGPFVLQGDIPEVQGLLEQETWKRSARITMIPLKEAAGMLGISDYILKNLVSEGAISAERINSQMYFSLNEIQHFQERRKVYIGVMDFVQEEILPIVKTVWNIEDRTNRSMLNLWLKNNPAISTELVTWERIGIHGDRRNSYYFPREIQKTVKTEILKYMEDYGFKQERLDMFMADPYWKQHSLTLKIFNEFTANKNIVGRAALAEVIVKTLSCDITECTNDDIESVVKFAKDRKAVIYEMYVVMFANDVKRRYRTKYNITLKYSRKEKYKSVNTDPYSNRVYYQIAVMVFNKQYIAEHGLINKALKDPKYAAMWLYCAWMFVGAWRATDVFGSLPVLKLPDSPKEIFDKIRGNTYKEAAITASMMLESEIMGRNAAPHKTRNRQHQRNLTVVFPETLREIIGTIYAINCAHHPDAAYFPSYRFPVSDYVRFFGPEYRVVLGNSVLSNRRANKAFLSNVAEAVENGEEHNRAMGYAIASYARAHVSNGKDQLSQVTSVYLRHELDGLSTNEVLTLLFETGTCSFIPYMLLKTLYGTKYTMLPIFKQNALLKESGLTADNTEQTMLAVTKNFVRAQEIVSQIVCGDEEQRHELAVSVLENILNRTALAKEPCMGCLMMASRRPCRYPAREGCIGCEYAIMQKGILFTLLKKIEATIQAVYEAKTEGERKKLEMLLEYGYVPALQEMLFLLKNIYHMDVREYIEKYNKLME